MIAEMRKIALNSTLEAQINEQDPAEWAVASTLRTVAGAIYLVSSLGGDPLVMVETLLFAANELDNGAQKPAQDGFPEL